MGDIVNLRRARKAKARVERADRASDNRVAFGTPKLVKDLEARRKKRVEADLDGHRLTSRGKTGLIDGDANTHVGADQDDPAS